MMNSGKIQAEIIEHINECTNALSAMRERNGEIYITAEFVALMQAKSTALVALSNTRAQRI
ncbi:hypothetical protein D3C71_234520 [compost metagenome]